MKAKLKEVWNAKKTFSEDEDSDVQDNAGDQFGGRKKKKQKKHCLTIYLTAYGSSYTNVLSGAIRQKQQTQTMCGS